MLAIVDILFTIVHLSIIFFNLFGWIPKVMRKAHFVSILLTAASWFLLGIWFGTGYCPLTDWQWAVKERLGEKNIPGNFIEYIAEKLTGHDFEPQFVNTITATGFGLATLLSIYVNFVLPYITKRKLQQL